MGMQTNGRIEIAKPAAEVFRWLVEPEKLTAWAGGAGLMPADPSTLAQQSPEVQAAMHHAIDLMNSQVGTGTFDATAQQGMQAALDRSLARLKQLAEA